VFDVVCEGGGMTMQQVADSLGVGKNTISGRFGELVKDGVLEVKKHVIENGSRVGVYSLRDQTKPNFESMRQEVINSWRKPITNSQSLF
jgi:predicted ArsR family transcriptional regulator